MAKTCGECKKFHTPNCAYSHVAESILKGDTACDEFEPKPKSKTKKGKRKTWKLKLEAEIPKRYEPCGFFEDTIIESAWLPYQESDTDEIALRPSLIIKSENGEVQVKDFLAKDLGLNVKGTFPSQDLKTLMGIKAVRSLLEGTEIDPKTVDVEIDEAMKQHVAIGNKRRIVLKRWIEGTYFYDVFDHFPILNVMGVSESGKSRILRVVQALSYHAEGVVDPSPASIFRSKEEDRVTLCFDEAEYLNIPAMNQTLRVLINASYSRGLSVPRYDEINGKRVKRKFNLYSPFAIVGISGLEGITASRAIRIVTERSNKDYPVAKVETYEGLRDKLYVLRFQKAFELKEIYDKIDISDIVSARFVELFKPLFALTKIFGNDEEFRALAEWAKEYQNVFRIEALNVATEEQILMTLAKLEPLADDWYQLKDLTDKVNLTHGRKLSYQRVSQILHRIGITQRRKVKGVTQFRVSRSELELIGKRLGIELPEISESTKPKQILESIDVFCRLKWMYEKDR